MASTIDLTERTSEPAELRIGPRLRELWSFREVLGNLVRRELKIKYTASFLGALWSLLNPVVFLAVFSFVVQVLRNRVPDFPVFLLSGLLAWNFFSSSVLQSTRSVVDNANLVKKVAFPRELLPLTSIGVALVDLALQTVVLVLFIVVSERGLGLEVLALYPLSLLALIAFTTAVALWAASANVRFRDVQHLLGIGLLVWFWATPIVYQAALVQQEFPDLWTFYLLNPMTVILLGFQWALYGTPSPGVLPDVSLAWTLALAFSASLVFLYLTWRRFFRRSGDFAEEL